MCDWRFLAAWLITQHTYCIFFNIPCFSKSFGGKMNLSRNKLLSLDGWPWNSSEGNVTSFLWPALMVWTSMTIKGREAIIKLILRLIPKEVTKLSLFVKKIYARIDSRNLINNTVSVASLSSFCFSNRPRNGKKNQRKFLIFVARIPSIFGSTRSSYFLLMNNRYI